jgi:chromatin segregation and condensation protein Rec8/ScpA/Scc1 (kleisin family)
MNPEGVPIQQPEPPKDDPQALKVEIMRLTRQIQAERQASAQTLATERAKGKAEMDKLRQATSQHGRDLENQNSALLQSLGRMKAENDELQRKVMMLEVQSTQAVQTVPRVQAEPTSTVAVLPQVPALSGEAIPQKAQ